MDYKALLKKYMDYVIDREGFDYIPDVGWDTHIERWSGKPRGLGNTTQEDVDELQRISDEIITEYTVRNPL